MVKIMKKVNFKPTGVCSREMIVECDDNNIVTNVEIVGGCPGNTVGVSKLCVGKSIDELIPMLEGIPCGFRSTSCPDQLSKALSKLKETN